MIEYGGKRFRELFLRRAAQDCHNTEWRGTLDLEHSATGIFLFDPSPGLLEPALCSGPQYSVCPQSLQPVYEELSP